MSADPFAWRNLRQPLPVCADKRGHALNWLAYSDGIVGERFVGVSVRVLGELAVCTRCGASVRVQVVVTGDRDSERFAWYKRAVLAAVLEQTHGS